MSETRLHAPEVPAPAPEAVTGSAEVAALSQTPATPGLSASGCAGCGVTHADLRCSACGAASAPGGFTTESLLAATPHGRVYRARAADGTLVALKELVFAVAPDARTIDAFEREAHLLEGVQHPAVPRFVRFFREGAGADLRLYLAQELVLGESLQQRIARRRLDEAEARDVATQALEILTALHGRTPRLLHRDLKPANLIVRPDGRIALVDFGSARASEKGATHGATVTGTFGYAPLEQLGGSADERSDLYGLGATLIHAITGIPPGELLTPGFAIDFKEHAQVSAQLRDFLAALVAPRASERPASAALAAGLLRSQAPPHRPRRAFADLSVNAAPMPADGVFKLIWIVSELDWPKLAWIGCKVAAVAFLELCAISAGALAYELSSGRLTAYNLFHLLD